MSQSRMVYLTSFKYDDARARTNNRRRGAGIGGEMWGVRETEEENEHKRKEEKKIIAWHKRSVQE